MEKVNAIRQRGKGGERGYSLVELVLVLAIITALAMTVYYVYKQRIEPNAWASNKFNLVQSIIAGVEQAKASRGGVYPAYQGDILNSSVLSAYLTRNGANANDLMGVRYSCQGGVNRDLTITVPVNDGSVSGISNLIDKLTSAGLQAYVNGTDLVVVIPSVNCENIGS